MDKKITYHEQTSRENTLKLRSVLQTLPDFTKDFFRAIEPNTSAKTRISYVYDIRLFFQFLNRAIVKTAAVHAKRNVAFFVFRQKRFYDFFVKFGKIFRSVVFVVERFCRYSVFFKKIVRRRFCRFDVNVFCLFQKLFGAEAQIVLIKPETNYGNHSTLPES